jgi:hypothetical protein
MHQPITYRIASPPEGYYVYHVDPNRRTVTVDSDLFGTHAEALSFVQVTLQLDAMYQDALDVDMAQEPVMLPA